MIKKNGIILLEEDDLGVDMNEIYQEASYYDKRLPQFEDIYDVYKIEVMHKNINAHAENTRIYLKKLRTEDDYEGIKQVPVEELPTLSKVELQFYLDRKFYAYTAGLDILNPPIREVW